MNRGFTLLEIIVAPEVVSTGIIGVFSAVLYGMRLRHASRERNVAQNAAKSKTEEIIGADFSSVVATYAYTGFAVSGLAPVDGDPDGQPGRVLIGAAADPTLVGVEVEVEWAGAFARNRASFRTLLVSQ